MIEPIAKREFTQGSERVAVSALIKDLAREVGFQKIGIVRAEALTEEGLRLQQWLARGFHGEMKWMEREPSQRSDPRQLFSDAKSIIVVALNYYTPYQHQIATRGNGGANSEATGKVSRYAWGDDYHQIVGEKLRHLLALIKERWPNADGKACVDIQPTMDKAWAVRAGLGWMGKHTNVITKEFGSWIFIGELLLNLELEYDELEVADQCGSCTLCIDTCPTGAIVEPYVVDSNRCISHATIESRASELSHHVAINLEDWLYGCDICQDVCPWNQMTPPSEEPGFEPREGNANASLSAILELTPETYATRFRGSAMKRAKLTGLQRNARTLSSQRESRAPSAKG